MRYPELLTTYLMVYCLVQVANRFEFALVEYAKDFVTIISPLIASAK